MPFRLFPCVAGPDFGVNSQIVDFVGHMANRWRILNWAIGWLRNCAEYMLVCLVLIVGPEPIVNKNTGTEEFEVVI